MLLTVRGKADGDHGAVAVRIEAATADGGVLPHDGLWGAGLLRSGW
jgi:hypothetical protein